MKYRIIKDAAGFTVWRKGWFFWHVVKAMVPTLDLAKAYMVWDKKDREPSVVVYEE